MENTVDSRAARARGCGQAGILARMRRRVARAIEGVRTRVLYKALDAVLTAPLRPRKGGLKRLRAIFGPRSPHAERVAELVSCIDSMAPGAGRRMSRCLLRPGLLPFRVEKLKLLASGAGSTVFLVETEGRRIVVKAYRRTLGKRRESLLELGAVYRKKFETVSTAYASSCEGPHAVVLPARFLILHAPLLRLSAVACVQSYLDGEKRDFFEDFDDGELLRLLKENQELRDQFIRFAERTLDLARPRGICVDLLGAQNLILVRERDSWTLKLIDDGLFDVAALEKDAPAVFARLSARLARLEGLVKATAL